MVFRLKIKQYDWWCYPKGSDPKGGAVVKGSDAAVAAYIYAKKHGLKTADINVEYLLKDKVKKGR